eukprot:1160312-Pelagomonas_calceolata.AAC.8
MQSLHCVHSISSCSSHAPVHGIVQSERRGCLPQALPTPILSSNTPGANVRSPTQCACYPTQTQRHALALAADATPEPAAAFATNAARSGTAAAAAWPTHVTFASGRGRTAPWESSPRAEGVSLGRGAQHTAHLQAKPSMELDHQVSGARPPCTQKHGLGA